MTDKKSGQIKRIGITLKEVVEKAIAQSMVKEMNKLEPEEIIDLTDVVCAHLIMNFHKYLDRENGKTTAIFVDGDAVLLKQAYKMLTEGYDDFELENWIDDVGDSILHS